ncbi:hypothetical protein MIDIC_110022 [Alphaproteobacteria bacterium]
MAPYVRNIQSIEPQCAYSSTGMPQRFHGKSRVAKRSLL